jgi:hypothetical protein
MHVDMIGKPVLVRVLSAAHEDHVLQEVSKALPVHWIVQAARVYSERHRCEVSSFTDLFGVVVLYKQTLEAVIKSEAMIVIGILRRLLKNNMTGFDLH